MGGITFLPFVRDSRNAPAIPQSASNKKAPPAEKKADSAKPAAPVAASTAPVIPLAAPAVAAGPEAELLSAINTVGDEVRQLKAAKVNYLLFIFNVSRLTKMLSKPKLTNSLP